MRKHLTLDLASREVTSKTVAGEDLARAGRWLIARTLLDEGVATVDPLSPANPLIFSSGPFAGTNFSNANRISVGCKSPLTGGIKEANSGGTFAYAMGQNEISGITLRQAADDWVVIHIQKDGSVSWDDAAPYMGKSNFAAAALLVEKYGDKTSFALCGPVGEYLGLVSGIAFPDPEGAPTRFAARGAFARCGHGRTALALDAGVGGAGQAIVAATFVNLTVTIVVHPVAQLLSPRVALVLAAIAWESV